MGAPDDKRVCREPGCSGTARGPRYGYLCKVHRRTPAEEHERRARLLEELGRLASRTAATEDDAEPAPAARPLPAPPRPRLVSEPPPPRRVAVEHGDLVLP